MPEPSAAEVPRLSPERVLAVCADPATLEQIRRAAEGVVRLETADLRSAAAAIAQAPPDVLVLDKAAAAELVGPLAARDDPTPVLVVGAAAAPPPGAFASLASAAELPAWLAAALRFRRLQLENRLIRSEANRIHSELLTSYGAASEQSHQLEARVERSAAELLESEEKYRALVSDASEAIFLVEMETGCLVEVNRRAEALTGQSKEKLLRLRLADLIIGEERTAVEQACARVQETGDLVCPNVTLRCGHGEPVLVDLTASRIRYAGHQVMQCICHDVTDRRRQETELRRQARDLEQQCAERAYALQQSNTQLVQQEKMAALGALVAGIAHDMHTPIGTITSNSDILSRSLARLRELMDAEGFPETVRRHPELTRVIAIVQDISGVNQLACERIISIVRSLRNYARLDEAERRTADLHEGLDSTLTLVHHELKNRITVNREYGDIPPIECHPNQLNQVFMNILVNASHAIEGKGTITIRTRRDGDRVQIQISDTGPGITPEHLPRIFDTGFTTKGAGVGTGLGLAICSKIVREHHGRIEVESQAGRGATFTIRLPIQWETS